jgi:hypothetical protein
MQILPVKAWYPTVRDVMNRFGQVESKQVPFKVDFEGYFFLDELRHPRLYSTTKGGYWDCATDFDYTLEEPATPAKQPEPRQTGPGEGQPHAAIWTEKGKCKSGDKDCWVVHIDGKIGPNDWQTFKQIVEIGKINKAVVVYNYRCGDGDSMSNINNQIQQKGFDTFVTNVGCPIN